jgi:dTDP-4-amino-4,6-dideoxygalactose transaminase
VPAENIPLVDLFQNHVKIRGEVHTTLDRILKSSNFILGREVEEFEKAFSRYVGTDHAIGVSNGTDALRLILQGLGIGEGCEVIVPTLTFAATAFAVVQAGAVPRFCDVDPDTATLDPAKLQHAWTRRVRAIIPVHLYGHPADMDPIVRFARKRGLKVVEDSAQAHGAKYKGNRVGGLGDASGFSFYPSKNLGALGDGGAVTTNDGPLTQAIRSLRNVGQRQKYHHEVVGYNNRLDAFQAGVLRIKLRTLESANDRRVRNARRYTQSLEGSGVRVPQTATWANPVYHLFIIRHPNRDQIARRLTRQGIACGVYYPVPLHLQECFRHLGYRRGDFPIAESISSEVLALPMYPELTSREIQRVSHEVRLALTS